jgi:hypothetical protein
LLFVLLGVSLPEVENGRFGLFGLDAVAELLGEGGKDLAGEAVDLPTEHHAFVATLGVIRIFLLFRVVVDDGNSLFKKMQGGFAGFQGFLVLVKLR